MKIRDIVQTANSNLLRSKIRTILTVTSIFVGSITLTLTIGIKAGISSYIDKQLGNIGAENILIVQPKVENMVSGEPQKYNPNKDNNTSGPLNIPMVKQADIEKIDKVQNIIKTEPIIVGQIDFVKSSDSDKYVLGVSSYITGTNLDLLAGSLPDNQSDAKELILPEDYLKPFNFKNAQEAVGQSLSIATTNTRSSKQIITEAKITGVQATSIMSSDGASGNYSLMNSLHQSVTDGLPESLKDSYLSVIATVKDGLSQDQLDQTKSALSDQGFSAQTVKDRIGIINQVINAITAVLIFFGAIALFAASFGIINTLFMSVQERTREIGLMKAMGMSRRKVFMLFSIEAVLIGFWGSLLGILAATGVGRLANRYASEHFLKYFSGFNLFEFPPLSLLVIMAIVMAIAFIAGTLPSRRAAKQDAIEALRYE